MSKSAQRLISTACILLLACAASARAEITLNKTTLQLAAGDVEQLKIGQGNSTAARWKSANPVVAAVYGNGYVCGVHPGRTTITVDGATCAVHVVEPNQTLVPPSSLKQYTDNRKFTVKGRKCYGSELNGQRASDPKEHANLESNRVINPRPVSSNEREWELVPGVQAFDGAGVPMGKIAAKSTTRGQRVPLAMFNFGMSKVLHDQLCVYAYAITIEPSAEVQKIADAPTKKSGKMSTSAWIPLEQIVDNAALLDRIGLGEAGLPRLPLEAAGHVITGGNPEAYMTSHGELAIVKALDGPIPSHYLRRPTGTVNIIYSVPGFGLGGQSLDSFLVSDHAIFHQAKGAKVFVQPTYFPKTHPQAGKVAPKKMTFLYGAVEVKDSPPVYGWIAKEALAPAR